MHTVLGTEHNIPSKCLTSNSGLVKHYFRTQKDIASFYIPHRQLLYEIHLVFKDYNHHTYFYQSSLISSRPKAEDLGWQESIRMNPLYGETTHFSHLDFLVSDIDEVLLNWKLVSDSHEMKPKTRIGKFEKWVCFLNIKSSSENEIHLLSTMYLKTAVKPFFHQNTSWNVYSWMGNMTQRMAQAFHVCP